MKIYETGSVWLCWALLWGCSPGTLESSDAALGTNRQAATTCVTPRSNLVVTTNTTLCPGTYNIADPENDGVVQIRAHNVELVISGVTLHGAGSGYGITATNFNGATIRSAPTNRGRIENFTSAIFITGGASHRVLENILSFNARRPIFNNGDDFLQIHLEFEDQLARQQIGNGVVLRNVVSATVTNNQMRFQQNGISLFGSNNVRIQGNDCSDNQGWGIHLFRSSNNTVVSNRADNVHLEASPFCVATQDAACDTASLLVNKGSNDNTVQSNSFKNGGDGVFAAAVDPFLVRDGADRNRYIGNDASFAKHHGIESTFSRTLLVENNTVRNAGRAGLWLGGSSDIIVRRNTVTGSGFSAIENEGASNVTIEQNTLSNSVSHGINLRGFFAFGDFTSTNYFIARNTIQNNGQFGIFAVDTHAINATGNVISSNGLGSVHLELQVESSLTGPIAINENQLLDANKPCGGVDVTCDCSVFDGDATSCNATQGCEFFACSNRCERDGTSQCDAGCGGCTSCQDHNGNLPACDADPACAYYSCTESCFPEGTPLEVGCFCRTHDGNAAACNAAAGCQFFACSGACMGDGVPACLAGCLDQCPGEFDCTPIENVTNVTSNWWGTTNPAQIDAAICGADLNFIPFKTSP